MKLTGDRLSIQFGTSPVEVRSLEHRLTRGRFARNVRQSLVIRLPQRVSDPVFLTEASFRSGKEGEVVAEFADLTGEYGATLTICPDANGIRFEAAVSAPDPIWLFEWRLEDLELREVIVPALGGQVLRKQMPRGTTLSYKYPFWWNAQFVLGAIKGGGMWLRTMERDPRFALVRVKRTESGFDLALGFEAGAPLQSTTLTARWYLDCYDGSWKVPVELHRHWLEETFSLTPLEQNPRVPEWAKKITAILELWGIGKERPEPMHTFHQMAGRLKEWSTLHPPSETLLYLPGFAEHGIDSRAPDYSPSVYLGGAEGFRHLVKTARAMGFRVMVHTNVLAMVYDHPEFKRFAEHQVVDAFGQRQGWGLDIDGDWLPEPYFAYINPGVSAWGDLIEGILGGLIREFNLDAVFLDQTLLAFNVSKGPPFIQGMRDHLRRLRQSFPQTLFAGEGLHEHVLAELPMAQIHGVDSIAEVHGIEGEAPWRDVHPVSSHLFRRYTRLTAHLLTRHPTHPMFARQESAYAALDVIPALALYHQSQSMDLPAVRRMLRRARRLPWRTL